MVKKPSWADPAEYAYTKYLKPEGWAWEFLAGTHELPATPEKEFEKEAAALEKGTGPRMEERPSRPAIFAGWTRDGETLSEWRRRAMESGSHFREFGLEGYYAHRWGLVDRTAQYPRLKFQEVQDEVKFLPS